MNAQKQVEEAVERQAKGVVRELVVNGVEFENTRRFLEHWFAERGVEFHQRPDWGTWQWQTTDGIVVDEKFYLTFHELLDIILDYVEERAVLDKSKREQEAAKA